MSAESVRIDDTSQPRESGPQRRARLAAEGRHGGLLAELERSSPGLIDPEETWDQIRLACRVQAHEDPAAFGRAALDETAAFVGYLAQRCQDSLRSRLAAHDRAARDFGLSGSPPELEGRALDSLLKLQGHLASLLETRAKLERRWKMVEPGAGLHSEAVPKASPDDPGAGDESTADRFDASGDDWEPGMFEVLNDTDEAEPLPEDEDRDFRSPGHDQTNGCNGHGTFETSIGDVTGHHDGASANGSDLGMPSWWKHRFRFATGGTGNAPGRGRSKRRRRPGP